MSVKYSVIAAIGCKKYYTIKFIWIIVKAIDYVLFLVELLVGY
jgi:hypothetical protein